MKLKAIIFDLDGTLVDSTQSHVLAWLEASRIFGLRNIKADDVMKLMGKTSHDIALSLIRLARSNEEMTEKMAKLKDRLFSEKYASSVKPIDCSHDLVLEFKKRKLKICVVSSNPRDIIRKMLNAANLISLVDVIVGQDEVKEGKPSPEPIILALKRLSIKSENAIVIGDSIYDIIAARKANVKAIGVNEEENKRKEMIKYGASMVFSSLCSLLNYIRSNVNWYELL